MENGISVNFDNSITKIIKCSIRYCDGIFNCWIFYKSISHVHICEISSRKARLSFVKFSLLMNHKTSYWIILLHLTRLPLCSRKHFKSTVYRYSMKVLTFTPRRNGLSTALIRLIFQHQRWWHTRWSYPFSFIIRFPVDLFKFQRYLGALPRQSFL